MKQPSRLPRLIAETWRTGVVWASFVLFLTIEILLIYEAFKYVGLL